MTNLINKIIVFAFPILTPGVLILGYLVISETIEETVTKDKVLFAIPIFILWAIAFYYYRKIKANKQGKQ